MSRPGAVILLAAALAACGAPPPRKGAPSAGELRTLLARGPGANIAVTSDSAADSLLRTRVLPAPQPLVKETLASLAASLPRWQVIAATDEVIWATRTTRLFRFVDDVYILVEPRDDSTAIHVRSASRIGESDLGQNRRNIGELLRAIDAFVAAHTEQHAHPTRRQV